MSAPGANAVNARAGFLTDIESHDVPFRIFLFGQFRIEHADRALTEPDWRRQHPKRLLQLLAAAPRRTLTRDEVVEGLGAVAACEDGVGLGGRFGLLGGGLLRHGPWLAQLNQPGAPATGRTHLSLALRADKWHNPRRGARRG